jgi:hypothetical protein
MGGRETQAEELATKCMEDTESLASGKLSTANILCLLGDIKQDGSFYERAWEVSEKKCARAMRSLARIHFYKNDF